MRITLEQAMADDRAGRRWTVFAHYSAPNMIPDPDKSGWMVVDPETKPAYWVVGHRTHSLERGRFPSAEEAEAFAAELNRLDVQGPIPPEFTERRRRLKELAPYFQHWAYTSKEGPPEARWPVDPDRFLIFDAGVGFHAEEREILVPDRAAIEDYLRGEEVNVYRIVDLDTGFDVRFKRDIVVAVEVPPA